MHFDRSESLELRGANVSGVDLRGADLTGADLRDTNLTDVSWEGARGGPIDELIEQIEKLTEALDEEKERSASKDEVAKGLRQELADTKASLDETEGLLRQVRMALERAEGLEGAPDEYDFGRFAKAVREAIGGVARKGETSVRLAEAV